MSYYDSQLNNVIQDFRIMTQYLIGRNLNMGLASRAYELKQIDYCLLLMLEHKSSSFNFINQIVSGKSLFVGEGNLSFVKSLLEKDSSIVGNITATTFEDQNNLTEEAKNNAEILTNMGVRVLYNIDATNLAQSFRTEKFNNIIFQFPHTGSREPIEGRNPNFVLVRDFFISAAHQLDNFGTVVISTVDNPHLQAHLVLMKQLNLLDLANLRFISLIRQSMMVMNTL